MTGSKRPRSPWKRRRGRSRPPPPSRSQHGSANCLPWRKTGQIYLDWRKDEVARLIPERIAERAGVSGIAAAHLQEVDRLRKGLRKRSDEEVWRYHWLRKRADGEAVEAWRQAHNALLTELPPTIPTAADLQAEAGGPCYWITSMTLAIT